MYDFFYFLILQISIIFLIKEKLINQVLFIYTAIIFLLVNTLKDNHFKFIKLWYDSGEWFFIAKHFSIFLFFIIIHLMTSKMKNKFKYLVNFILFLNVLEAAFLSYFESNYVASIVFFIISLYSPGIITDNNGYAHMNDFIYLKQLINSKWYVRIYLSSFGIWHLIFSNVLESYSLYLSLSVIIPLFGMEIERFKYKKTENNYLEAKWFFF